MTPQELKQQLDSVYLIDVREEDELADKIQQAKSIPMSRWNFVLRSTDQQFQETFGFAKFTKTDKLVLICFSGARSGHLVTFLKRLGYDAHNLEGGMCAWTD